VSCALSDWQAARRGQVQANLETSAEYRAKDGDSRKRRRDAIQNLRMASLGATARVSMFQEVDEAFPLFGEPAAVASHRSRARSTSHPRILFCVHLSAVTMERSFQLCHRRTCGHGRLL